MTPYLIHEPDTLGEFGARRLARKEEWRAVPNCSGHEVSSLGRVRRRIIAAEYGVSTHLVRDLSRGRSWGLT